MLPAVLQKLTRLILPGAARSTPSGLTQEERALFDERWYHDFASLGVPTPDPASSHQENQRYKQPILANLIDRAIARCRKDGGAARGVELFCADGLYANLAIRAGADSVLGIDLDERAIARARLITRLLGHADRSRFEQRDVFQLEGTYDFAICAGGLYHLQDPSALLVSLRARLRAALVVQTVYSLAVDARDYFETPAPGWTWGCRFSLEYLLRMVRDAGWDIVSHSTNVLGGNSRPEDRGSAYLLCVPCL